MMETPRHRYFVLNKPFDMVSQFISPDNVHLLGEIDFPFPEGTHAIGRLDNHSEGLLLLTTNKRVTRLLFQGEKPHERTYLVKVKNVVTEEALEQLRNGVLISASHGSWYKTLPCKVILTDKPAHIAPRPRYNEWEAMPHSWIEMTLTEGKFHQVRKMVDSLRHRCLRLIRTSIEDIELGSLPPGGVKEYEEEEFFRLLKIDNWRE